MSTHPHPEGSRSSLWSVSKFLKLPIFCLSFPILRTTLCPGIRKSEPNSDAFRQPSFQNRPTENAMISRRPLAVLAAVCLMAGVLLTSSVSAETVIKFDLAGSAGPDVQYSSSSLSTIADGLGVGDKSTDVEYFGFLKDLPAITSGASLTLSGVSADGAATVIGGVVVQQATTGGTFSLYDDMDALLLSGNLGSGLITGFTGPSASPTGSFLSVGPVNFTGGSLFPLLHPSTGAVSLSFSQVKTGTTNGMQVSGSTLLDFTAVANGAIDASAVPEPSVLGMAALGAVAMIRRRRRRTAKKA